MCVPLIWQLWQASYSFGVKQLRHLTRKRRGRDLLSESFPQLARYPQSWEIKKDERKTRERKKRARKQQKGEGQKKEDKERD
jgi:hypothetical protein